MLFSQPVAEEPFRFETELDDLPKEKLKGDLNVNTVVLILINLVGYQVLGAYQPCSTEGWLTPPADASLSVETRCFFYIHLNTLMCSR